MGRWMGRDTRSEERGIRILIFMRCDVMGWDVVGCRIRYDARILMTTLYDGYDTMM